MNKYPFMKMLLKVGTKMSDTMHEYLISLKEVMLKYVTYQYHFQKVEVNRKDKLLQEKEEELSKLTYALVDKSLSRIIAYQLDLMFPSIAMLYPKQEVVMTIASVRREIGVHTSVWWLQRLGQ